MKSARMLLIYCLGACCLGLDAGCTSCQSPYDYSGPTVGPDGKPIGEFGTRMGSAWAGTTPNAPRPTVPTVASGTPADEGPAGLAPAAGSAAGQAPPAALSAADLGLSGTPAAETPNDSAPDDSAPDAANEAQPASYQSRR